MNADIEQAVIVSDLHIGLPYFRREKFLSFVRGLSPDFALILNGDTIDDPYKSLGSDDQTVVEFLKEESDRREVYWIYGNHDEDYRMADPGGIVFTKHLEVGHRLMIAHGDDFDEIMTKSMWFIRLFRALHELRIKLGAHPVHVAEFAKKCPRFLYAVLTEGLKKNAVKCAIENGFEAIICGHVHQMEDAVCDGVRYLNTATWTEEPPAYVEMTPKGMTLKTMNGSP